MKMVDARHGTMLVNEKDEYIGRSLALYGEFSEGEAELFAKLELAGGDVCEVGSNIGAHTLPLSRMSRRVWALEPQRLVYQMLCANLALNDVRNVIPVWAAAGKKIGEITVPVCDPDVRQNFGGVSLGDVAEGEKVAMIRVDDLAIEDLRLLKVDVEGMELEVLAGAVETIREFEPLLYVENDRPEKSEKLLEFMIDALGYECWWHFPPLYRMANKSKNMQNVFPGLVSANVLAVPPGMSELGERLLPGYRVLSASEKWKNACDRIVQPLSTRGPIEARLCL